jgi:hypothetical protein
VTAPLTLGAGVIPHPEQRVSPLLFARQRREPCCFCGRDLAGKVGRVDTIAGPVCWPDCRKADSEPRLPLEE